MNKFSKPTNNEAEPPSLEQESGMTRMASTACTRQNLEISQKGAAVFRHCPEIITLAQINILSVHINV